MKYVEPIKSFLLFFLVALSLVLTVMIWNYKPNHQFIEGSSVENALTSDKKPMKEIFKPYKAVSRIDDGLKGTTSSNYMDSIYDYFEKVHATDITLVNNNLSVQQMNELMHINNRTMLFLSTEVPLRSFTKVLHFTSENLPEMTFDRIIIDWNDLSKNHELTILFLNTGNKTLYRTSIANQNEARIKDTMIEPIDSFFVYTVTERPNLLELYLPMNAVEAVKYMYFINESPIEQYKKVLFEDEKIVNKSNETATTDRYMDSVSVMMVDTKNRILNYVYPNSEGLDDIPASKLLDESFAFINDHGGYNADYRISLLNASKHLVEYQLFYQGLPVFSAETTTKISTTWGNDQVYGYRRPYYVLEMDIPTEMKIKELPSGQDVFSNHVMDSKNVKDLIVGYDLVQNIDLRVFELEPAWFILKDNSWEHIKPEDTRGLSSGLE